MKKTVLLIAAALVIAAGACYVGVRLHNRGRDIIGVTTLNNNSSVIMNSRTGEEFVSGAGKLTVGEGEHIHLRYELSAGSFDLAFHKGEDGLDVFDAANLEALPESGEVYGRSGVSGNGALDFPAEEGVYTVFFQMHGAIGTAELTAEK